MFRSNRPLYFLLLGLLIALAGQLLLSQSARAQTVPDDASTDIQPSGSKDLLGSKWFVRVYGSYGLPMASSFRPGDFTSSSSTSTGARPTSTTTYKINRKGLGQGWRVGAGVGYIVNEVINLGIDVDQYWSGGLSAISELGSSGRGTITYSSTTYTAEMLTLTPNITFKAISKPGFYIYNRLGVSVGIRNELTQMQRDSTVTSSLVSGRYENLYENTYQYEGGLPIGFLASLGVQVYITNNIRFFAEVQVISIANSPKKRILTSSFINGNDRFIEENTTSLRDREIQYVNEYTTEPGEVDNGQPTKEIKLRIPYASIGLSAGLAYRF